MQHWNDRNSTPTVWNTLIAAGKALPGIANINVKKGRNFDKKKAAGSDGMTITDNGLELATVTIKLQVWTPEQLNELSTTIRTLFPSIGKLSQPIIISNPQTDFHQVTSIWIETIETSDPSPVDGWVVTLNCTEWAPAPKVTKTTNTPKSGSPAANTNNANGTSQTAAKSSGSPTSDAISSIFPGVKTK